MVTKLFSQVPGHSVSGRCLGIRRVRAIWRDRQMASAHRRAMAERNMTGSSTAEYARAMRFSTLLAIEESAVKAEPYRISAWRAIDRLLLSISDAIGRSLWYRKYEYAKGRVTHLEYQNDQLRAKINTLIMQGKSS